MSIKTDNYIRFFQDQVTEIQREYNKTKAVPMKQLFRDEIITLATIDSVTSTATHFVMRRYKELDVELFDTEEDTRGQFLYD